MNNVYLLIGGNMGDRKAYLAAACKEVEKHCGAIVQQSSLYQTAAWGLKEQADFLNQVLQVRTSLDAPQLLKTVLQTEETLGRKRAEKYGPRIIDIDVLLFNDEIIQQEGLTVPHPQLQNRRFALVPLAEIAAGFVHPVFQQTIAQLLAECPDRLDVHKIS